MTNRLSQCIYQVLIQFTSKKNKKKTQDVIKYKRSPSVFITSRLTHFETQGRLLIKRPQSRGDLAETNGHGVSSDGSRRANGSDVWCLRWTFLDGFICLLTVANELIPSRSCSRRGGFAAQEIRGVTNTSVTHVSGALRACLCICARARGRRRVTRCLARTSSRSGWILLQCL